MKCPYCEKSQKDNAQLGTAERNCENYGSQGYNIQCINPKCKEVFRVIALRTAIFGKPVQTDCTDPDFPLSIG